MKRFLVYTIPVILSLAVGMIGSYVQSPAIEQWYPMLVKSPLTPPAIVFPIAWTILYILMGLSISVMIDRGDMSLVRLWLFQLIVNFLWSVAFFALRSPLAGLIVILVLDVLVFTYTIYAFGCNRAAGWLFVPYMVWLLFATYLTGYIYLNNSSHNYPQLRAANAPQMVAVVASQSYYYPMPPLPYSREALEPAMSSQTLDYHYGKHLKTYVDNLNRMVVGSPYEGMSLEDVVAYSDGSLFNNAAQVWNHTLFFDGMTPNQVQMPQRLKAVIIRDFGSVEQFKREFTVAAASLFGSGWVWLTESSGGKLSIVSTSNAACPIRQGLNPLLVLDVWEHAYYIDYRNRRGDYIDNWWGVVDWSSADSRLKYQ